MGYFDGLADAAFKEDEQGNALFYPFGIFGKGRVIPNEKEKQSLRTILKRYYQILLPLIILLSVIGLWKLTISFALISLIPFYWLLFRRIRNFEITKSTLTFKESSKNSARSHNKITLWLLFIVSLLFVLMGIFILAAGSKSWLLGMLCTIFFGLCALSIGYMIKIKEE